MQYSLFGDYENALTYLTTSELIRLSKIALEVHRRLSQIYVVPTFDEGRMDLVSQLIYAILSQRTRSAQSEQAFNTLRINLKDWIRLLDEPVMRIEQLIAGVTFADQKARRLPAVSFQILKWNDGKQLSLDLVRDLPDVDAVASLRRLDGVGWKTSSCAMLLSVERRPVLPVDTHGQRVRKRLGLIPEKLEDSGRIHAIARALLPADWKAQELEREYFLIKRHGQNCCTHNDPNCGCCPLLDICQYGQKMMN